MLTEKDLVIQSPLARIRCCRILEQFVWDKDEITKVGPSFAYLVLSDSKFVSMVWCILRCCWTAMLRA